MQEEMHEQMSGYKRMRREQHGALVSFLLEFSFSLFLKLNAIKDEFAALALKICTFK